MKFRNQFMKYMAPAQDGSEGGGGGDAGTGDEGGKDGDPGEDPEKAKLLQEVMKKKGKIKELETSNQNLQTQFDEFKAQFEGIDLERYKNLTKSADEAEAARKLAEQDKLKAEGKIDELLKARTDEHDGIVNQMRDQHQKALDKLKQQLEESGQSQKGLQGQIEKLTVGTAFGNSELIRDKLISAMTPARMRNLYGAYFDTADDGTVIGHDKPRGAEGRTQLVDQDGNPVKFDEALTRILQADGDYDAVLRNTGDGGSGSGSSNREPSTPPKIGSGIDRVAYAMEKQNKG